MRIGVKVCLMTGSGQVLAQALEIPWEATVLIRDPGR